MMKSPYENVYLYNYDTQIFYRNDGNGEELYSPVEHTWFPTHDEEVFFYRNQTVEVDPETVPYMIQFLDTLPRGWGEKYKGVDFLSEAKKLQKAHDKPRAGKKFTENS